MVLTFLGMSYQHPPAGSVDNVPNTDHRVVAARNESTSPCGKGTDGMLMTFKVQLMIWVFVDVLLRNNQPSQSTGELCIMGRQRTSAGSISTSSAPSNLYSGSPG